MELVIPAAGAAIGFFASGGNPVGAQVGWMVGSAISAYVNQPDTIEAPQAKDLSYSGSSYGLPVARVWGTVAVAGSYIWAPDIEVVTSTEGGGGSNFGPDAEFNTYYGSFGVIFCEGPVFAVRRIWFDTQLVYDASDTNLDGPFKKKGLSLNIHLGTTTQEADPVIEEYEGAGNVSGHRGFCYIVVDAYDLTEHGNKFPSSVRAEIVKDDSGSDPNIVIGSIGTSQPRYSPVDGYVVTWKSTGEIVRWNADTGDIISTVKKARHDDEFIIGDDGIIHASTFNEDGDTQSWFFPITVDPTTGSTWLHECTTNPCYCSGYNPNADTCGENIDQLCKVANNHAIVSGIYFANGAYYYAFTNGNTATGYGYALPSRGCPRGWAISPTTGEINSIVGDSDGALWITDSGIDDIRINGAAMNVSSLTSPNLSGLGGMRWHVPSQTMILDTDQGLIRLAYDSSTSTVSVDAGPIAGTSWSSEYDRGYIYESYYWVRGNVTQLVKIDLWDMSGIRTLTPVPWRNGQFSGDPLYLPEQNAMFGMGGLGGSDFNKLLLDRVPDGGQELSTVVSEIASDIIDSRKNVSGLNQTVRGFLMSRPEENREAIRRLMTSHIFDGTMSGGKIKFIELDGSVDATIPEDDLAAHAPGTETPPQTTIRRTQETSLPRRVEISALSRELEYEPTVQSANRQLTPTTGTVKIQLMEVLTNDQAAQLAEVLLQTPPVERNNHEFFTSYKYLYLHPIDQVVLTKGNTTHRVRLTQGDKNSNMINRHAVSVDTAVYSSNATGAGGSGFVPTEVPSGAAATTQHMMSAPLLTAVEDTNTPGFYVGYSSYDTDWGGAVLTMHSAEDSMEVVRTLDTTDTECICGYATTALAHSDNTTTWDNTSTVNVQMINGVLSSSTDAAVIEGANAIYFIESGELIQFVNVAVANSPDDGEVTLSRLLRGRRGTEHATRKHVVNESFVLLTADTIGNIETSCDEFDEDFFTRATTASLTLAQTYPRTFRYVHLTETFLDGSWSYSTATEYREGSMFDAQNRLKPFSPVNAAASYDGSEVTITWLRRTREILNTNYEAVPLGEDQEQYTIVIHDNSGNLIATYTSTSESLAYTNAQMQADFGAIPSGFGFSIYQMSFNCNNGMAWRGWPLRTSTQEVNLFLSKFTDFSEHTDYGVMASDWSSQVTGLVNMEVLDGTASPRPAYLTYAPTGNIAHSDTNAGSAMIATWDNSNASSDMEVLIEYDHQNYSTGFNEILQVRTGQPGVDDLYPFWACGYSHTAHEFQFNWKNSAGGWANNNYTGTRVVSESPGLALNAQTFMRYRVYGAQHQAKIWQGSLGAEPSNWMLDATHSSTYYAGNVGVQLVGSSYDWAITRVAVAYNGNTASFS